MDCSPASPRPPRDPGAPALWGGVECTVNRVGDAWFDQLVRSGHHDRADDLDALAGLGVAALRYPVLWERTTRRVGDAPDFAWSDARLARLRALGVEPIVGLLHHGSGPAGTDLLDPRFPERLADYAGAVARRYPWVEKWTPVNEPLTTARFSGLYGHWYPHRRDDRAFAAMLLNQCRGTQLAMRAVRREVPGAQLVQTEDLGMTLSRPRLAYQAEFENERRWLSYDLLCGRVDGHHPLARWLRGLGVADDELAPLRDEPPPDLLGLNHYVTSVRFLDDRTGLYPPARVGGNHRHRYVDVEAVRVCASPPGVDALLHQAWERFRRPLAVTEAHLGCTEDEQVRWLAEVWEAASRLRRAGADLRAVTAWALLGSYDWHCLVTRADGCYEPGAFDVRDGAPRPTALAALIRGLADTGAPRHPALASPGWWRRPERLLHPPVRHARRAPAQLAV